MLYEKHNYLNKNISFLISNEIIEYDIKSAGYNLMKYFKMIDEEKLKYLESLDKKRRQIQIGLYIRENKELGVELNKRFVEVRQWFFEQNKLEPDDIISIKKDAIITLKRCLTTELGNIQFVEKNIYTSYYYLNDYEFYFNKDVIHVKGIKDEELELHKEYILDFLHNFFLLNEVSTKKKAITLLKEMAYYYKRKELQIGYYRELNEQSLYRLKDTLFEKKIGIRDIGDVSLIDISYNYIKYLIPLISILV